MNNNPASVGRIDKDGSTSSGGGGGGGGGSSSSGNCRDFVEDTVKDYCNDNPSDCTSDSANSDIFEYITEDLSSKMSSNNCDSGSLSIYIPDAINAWLYRDKMAKCQAYGGTFNIERKACILPIVMHDKGKNQSVVKPFVEGERAVCSDEYFGTNKQSTAEGWGYGIKFVGGGLGLVGGGLAWWQSGKRLNEAYDTIYDDDDNPDDINDITTNLSDVYQNVKDVKAFNEEIGNISVNFSNLKDLGLTDDDLQTIQDYFEAQNKAIAFNLCSFNNIFSFTLGGITWPVGTATDTQTTTVQYEFEDSPPIYIDELFCSGSSSECVKGTTYHAGGFAADNRIGLFVAQNFFMENLIAEQKQSLINEVNFSTPNISGETDTCKAKFLCERGAGGAPWLSVYSTKSCDNETSLPCASVVGYGEKHPQNKQTCPGGCKGTGTQSLGTRTFKIFSTSEKTDTQTTKIEACLRGANNVFKINEDNPTGLTDCLSMLKNGTVTAKNTKNILATAISNECKTQRDEQVKIIRDLQGKIDNIISKINKKGKIEFTGDKADEIERTFGDNEILASNLIFDINKNWNQNNVSYPYYQYYEGQMKILAQNKGSSVHSQSTNFILSLGYPVKAGYEAGVSAANVISGKLSTFAGIQFNINDKLNKSIELLADNDTQIAEKLGLLAGDASEVTAELDKKIEALREKIKARKDFDTRLKNQTAMNTGMNTFNTIVNASQIVGDIVEWGINKATSKNVSCHLFYDNGNEYEDETYNLPAKWSQSFTVPTLDELQMPNYTRRNERLKYQSAPKAKEEQTEDGETRRSGYKPKYQ
jgi:hypothetical protein